MASITDFGGIFLRADDPNDSLQGGCTPGRFWRKNIRRWATISRDHIHDAGHGTEKSAALLWSKAFQKQFSLLIGTMVQVTKERPPIAVSLSSIWRASLAETDFEFERRSQVCARSA
jgi:hypothetical protein